MTVRLRCAFALLTAALVLAVGSARATPGALDPGFGFGGTVTTVIGLHHAYATAVALQPDGKVVVVGASDDDSAQDTFTLARYEPNGSLDPTFGSGGIVRTPIGIASAVAYAVVLQPDGKIVVAGRSQSASQQFTIARYNADGSLDTDFGNGGIVTTAVGASYDEANAVVLQPDGKILAGGDSYDGSHYVFALARYNPDGSLDTGFGGSGTGIVTTPFGSNGSGYLNALALQPDGKILAAGNSWNGSQTVFTLARYNPDGSLDSTAFGVGGIVTTPIADGAGIQALVLQPDGKIIAAGSSWDGTNDEFALARYGLNGSLDQSFGSGGSVDTAIGSGSASAYAVVLQPDGRIVVAGGSQSGSQSLITLDRYNPDASLDATFGNGGILTTPIGIGGASARGLALQPDGKIVAAGGVGYNGAPGAFALVRYLGSTLTVTKTGSGSGTVSSSPGGISCGAACAASFAALPVNLHATPAGGSLFSGWSGRGCSGTGTCRVQMGADQSVTAVFNLPPKTLAVAKTGSGSGTVTSGPAGILCGFACTHAFDHGSAVTLTAKASSRSRFAGWSGDCPGRGTCALTMNANHSVTANFQRLCIVPKVRGKTLGAARKAIKKAHCSVGKVTRAFSAKVKKGRVISQKPAPRKRFLQRSKVRLQVSKGKRGTGLRVR
jgi:uncharacterized delta-60 repeat protein